MKKIIAMILALTMVLSLAATAFATDVTEAPTETLPAGSDSSSSDTDDSGVIKIENPNRNHIYNAYQIFTGDYNATTEELTGYEFGTGIDGAALIAALQGDATVGSYFTDDATAADVAIGLSELEKAGDSELLAAAFAIIEANLTQTYTPGAAAADGNYYIPAQDASGEQKTFLQAGYYLIDETNSENSPIMVKVVRGTTPMKQKGDEISVSVQVMDTDFEQANGDGTVDGSPARPFLQSHWQDVGDYSFGDDLNGKGIPIGVFVTLPDYSSFDYYNVLVTYVLPRGLSPVDFSEFYIYSDEGTIARSEAIVLDDATAIEEFENKTGREPLFVYTTETDETTGETTMKVYPYRQGNSPTAPSNTTGGDIMAVAEELDITIPKFGLGYGGALNSNAEIGLPGNTIKAQVQFTKDSTGAVATTPWDEAIVFTYELDVTKVDAIDNDLTLEGAQFVLYRKDPVSDEHQFARFKDGVIYAWAGRPAEGEDFIVGPQDLKYYPDCAITSDANGELKIIGLDDGVYDLWEIAAPDGYKLAELDVVLDIQATHGEADYVYQGDPNTALTDLQIRTKVGLSSEYGPAEDGSVDTGIVNAVVENTYISSLPETGGVGTTLFYIIGGLMVVCAAVVLVTKRRMSV